MPSAPLNRRDLFKTAALAIAAPRPGHAATLPETQLLDWDGDLSERMMDGAHRFVERKIAESLADRPKFWARDPSSHAAYEKSIQKNRERLAHITGVVDKREHPNMERFSDDIRPALINETSLYRSYQVRWPVLDGVYGEGLLFEPTEPPLASIVAVPDAGQTPEECHFAQQLAANRCRVLALTLLDRSTRWSGHPEIRSTDQSQREWIYRQAFHMGRHIIGYEVQKILAGVDWFQQQGASKIAVAGYGEGGLLAFYSAALDPRIQAALVSGYFTSRQNVWSEPIYRNVWSLLREFGDAEIATLIAPRPLLIAHGDYPIVSNQKGDLHAPDSTSVQAEFDRITTLLPDGFQQRKLTRPDHALSELSSLLGIDFKTPAAASPYPSFDPAERQKRQVRDLEKHVQSLIQNSEHVREKFFLYKVAPELADETWSTALRHKTLPPERIIKPAAQYRDYFRDEILGHFEDPPLPPNPRSRQLYDTPKFTGYEVVLDVWPDVFAWGILLIPKGIRPGERRPVVVCQHGRRGIPKETVEGDNPYYHDFAAHLAEQGFVTFAPHNLYRGEDRYRWLSRKGNGIRASLFSFILGQHEQILRWLGSLPMVDPARIGFYGLSYGGETAVRVPTVLPGYALSICSGDFNSWTEKVAGTRESFGFMYSIEWEMSYFNMGSTFDYAEMAYLMLPRPFMVERGHNDHVSRDQFVAREYAKVRYLYAQVGLEDKTEIEYFNGGHTINGQHTFDFLKRHLNWPGLP